ncbi:glutamyl-tRNA(Gln) amidotransferase subunit Aof mitochondrial isoform X1 [Spatholobus suberectus]|nr:glutamyl-tRNA(Gln) amidotransferase subunit Aof mitochondrial isoform X1 [Spatholobus suberectus]
MPKNKCPREAVTEWTRGSGGTNSFHFSRTVICCPVLILAVLLLAFAHSSKSSSQSPTFCSNGNLTNMGSKNQSQLSLKKCNVSSLGCFVGLLDANFFEDKQIGEIAEGANELNIPIIKANQKLVASENGGLHYPSPLVFNADWNYQPVHHENKRFKYPSISGIQRPESEEDIAFMSVLELGGLIKTKQITSQELTQIFLQRLKNTILLLKL